VSYAPLSGASLVITYFCADITVPHYCRAYLISILLAKGRPSSILDTSVGSGAALGL